MTTREIRNTDDVIDSRDVIERIAELQSILDDGESLGDDRDEYMALTILAEEGQGYADWEYGEILIRDSYFEDYARELAEDIGAIKGTESWPLGYIDWEAAAEVLQMDYSAIDFDGVTYWVRS
jgi:hypothetical protein